METTDNTRRYEKILTKFAVITTNTTQQCVIIDTG